MRGFGPFYSGFLKKRRKEGGKAGRRERRPVGNTVKKCRRGQRTKSRGKRYAGGGEETRTRRKFLNQKAQCLKFRVLSKNKGKGWDGFKVMSRPRPFPGRHESNPG